MEERVPHAHDADAPGQLGEVEHLLDADHLVGCDHKEYSRQHKNSVAEREKDDAPWPPYAIVTT